jgi:hypothetical protein
MRRLETECGTAQASKMADLHRREELVQPHRAGSGNIAPDPPSALWSMSCSLAPFEMGQNRARPRFRRFVGIMQDFRLRSDWSTSQSYRPRHLVALYYYDFPSLRQQDLSRHPDDSAEDFMRFSNGLATNSAKNLLSTLGTEIGSLRLRLPLTFGRLAYR